MPLTKEEFRRVFLKEFVMTLIEHSQNPELLEPKEEEFIPQLPGTSEGAEPEEEIKGLVEPQTKEEPELPELPELTEKPVSEIPEKLEPVPQIPEKLKPFLDDPETESIECPGAGKPLIINKAGKIEPTSITLSEGEIDSIIKKFSEETKTEVHGGAGLGACGAIGTGGGGGIPSS